MWFASTLDTSSPWGTSYSLTAPIQRKKEVGVLGQKPTAKLGPQTFAKDFVQISSTQRWNTQSFYDTPQTQKTLINEAVDIYPSEASLNEGIEPATEEDSPPQNLYKTELCRSFEETGSCRYGLKCQFAHSRTELRTVSRHPKYKTEVCKTFHTIGTCPYGKRCRFIHSEAPSLSPPTTLKITPKDTPKCDIKPPSLKPPVFQNASQGDFWSPNFTAAAFPSSTTSVNFNAVAKGLPARNPVEQFSPLSTMKESHERRSRLGIFQQICS